MTLYALLRHLGFALGLAILSAAMVRLMIAYPVLDHPDHRKAHKRPTPKGGGVGIVVAFALGMGLLFARAEFARLADPQFIGVIAAAVAMAVVAFLDDIKDFRFVVKLGAQALAGCVALASGLWLDSIAIPGVGIIALGPVVGGALTLFWIVACTNAVNFMDGLDGLVGGTMLIVCAMLCVIAASHGGWFVYAAALLLGAGIVGFLPFNLHPARIFMGDVGSQFLGFVVAVLGVAAARFDAMQISFLIVPLLLFAMLFDTAFTLLRRALRGERISTPHRTHLYQMAQRSGMSTWGVAIAHWCFAAFHAQLALFFFALPGEYKAVVLVPAILVQLLWLAYVAWRVKRAGLSWAAG